MATAKAFIDEMENTVKLGITVRVSRSRIGRYRNWVCSYGALAGVGWGVELPKSQVLALAHLPRVHHHDVMLPFPVSHMTTLFPSPTMNIAFHQEKTAPIGLGAIPPIWRVSNSNSACL